jgi:hypothetical protein
VKGDRENVVDLRDRLKEMAYTSARENNLELRRVFRRKKPSSSRGLAVSMAQPATQVLQKANSEPGSSAKQYIARSVWPPGFIMLIVDDADAIAL